MAVTGLSRATLHRYLRGDVAEALRYVAVAQQMIVSLRNVTGADGCADCAALPALGCHRLPHCLSGLPDPEIVEN